MKRSLNDLLAFHVRAKDGPEGKIKDFLFDEERWVVRYIDADFGKWFSIDRVLVPQIFLEEPDWDKNKFPVKLSREMIESGPTIDDHMPVSREYEKELMKYFEVEPYWTYSFSPPTSGSIYFPPRPLGVPEKTLDEKEVKTNLRSFREVEGYSAYAQDRDMCYVDDLIIDDEDWQIVYAVIDLTKWLPISKKVLISIEGIEEISYVEHKIVLSLKPDKLREAPHYDPDKDLSVKHEKDLYDYFSWGMVT
jgi:hypothetical protein